MSDKQPAKPDLPEETLRIMERMLKTPPKPHPTKGDERLPPESDKGKKRKPNRQSAV